MALCIRKDGLDVRPTKCTKNTDIKCKTNTR